MRAYLRKMQTSLRAWLSEQPKPHAIERLAEASEVPLRSLYRYAKGERTPPLRHALAIARVTGLPVEALLAEQGHAA
jgi:transcriptional regulator with XRE-family HTH domain